MVLESCIRSLFMVLACVPSLYYIGTDNSVANNNFHVMVMDLLGPSLEDLFNFCDRSAWFCPPPPLG